MLKKNRKEKKNNSNKGLLRMIYVKNTELEKGLIIRNCSDNSVNQSSLSLIGSTSIEYDMRKAMIRADLKKWPRQSM